VGRDVVCLVNGHFSNLEGVLGRYRRAFAILLPKSCRCKTVCMNECKNECTCISYHGVGWGEIAAFPSGEAETPEGAQTMDGHQMSDWRDGLVWQKSRRSNPSGNCVEMAELPNGEIAVRNSRDPEGAVLVYTREEVEAFVGGAKDGDFDHMLV
jgi:hypothetical protein